MLIQGTLMKGYGGFYYVYTDGRVWECSLRGRFRVKKQDFIPGDNVLILPGTGNKATIEKVLERKNLLTRPTIANVDQVFLVFACKTPDPDYNLLDRLLVQAGKARLSVSIIFTKSDLIEGIEDPTIEYYRSVGYNVFRISNKTGEGTSDVKALLKGHLTVLAGPSGTGKSSLINTLSAASKAKTGEVSAKIGRGKHTTRHVELISVAGGLLADTPGFSSLFLPEMKREELQNYFPEFKDFSAGCKFKSCLHDREPVCAVKEAWKNGALLASRYQHYLQFLQEVIENERRY